MLSSLAGDGVGSMLLLLIKDYVVVYSSGQFYVRCFTYPLRIELANPDAMRTSASNAVVWLDGLFSLLVEKSHNHREKLETARTARHDDAK